MKKFKLGLQLYSIREDMKEDMYKALKAVKEMGYDCVEFAGYFGKTATEVKNMLDELGLEAISVHQTPDAFFEDYKTNTDFLKVIGAKYCAIPWMDKERLITDEFIEQVKTLGKKFADDGIALMYHNHDFEFGKKDDKYILDWLYSSVPEKFLQAELDTCWVRYAGCDPVDYINKYAGRCPIIHLKDFVCTNFNMGPVYGLIDSKGTDNKPKDKAEAGFKFQPVGHGIQDMPSIIAAAEKAGAHTLIVEQDMSVDRTPMESAKMSIDYLKSLEL